jgi:hypothetical protein
VVPTWGSRDAMGRVKFGIAWALLSGWMAEGKLPDGSDMHMEKCYWTALGGSKYIRSHDLDS